ncbi:MAG: 1-acyl-sn-glycerol-3-phosphate acyltransferase [Burkholderiaceae bacterium]|nr:1-acyl-sn-glycerol-3-phosphate acyltransferase [Burkholderiaceae bacterium]
MLLTRFFVWLVRLLVGAYPRWIGTTPSAAQRIYFANHTSHLDTLVVWASMPRDLRSRTRVIAAQDYWDKTAIRRHIVKDGLNAVLIDRKRQTDADPLDPLRQALSHGDSLIIFPEGTRNPQPVPGPFKRGISKLAAEFPEVELVPVYCENLHRIMPKGTFFPVPLACNIRFGAPMQRRSDESEEAFAIRARDAVISLSQDESSTRLPFKAGKFQTLDAQLESERRHHD